MKLRAITWMAALALTGVCLGQQSEDETRFYTDYARSEQRAIADYPDAANANSPIAKMMGQIDMALKNGGDPLYYSADKPYIIAQRAASALGISAGSSSKPSKETGLDRPDPNQKTATSVEKNPTTPSVVQQPEKLKPGSPEWIAKRDDAWKRLQDYYPQYCDPAYIERTYQFVQEWDAWAKVNRPDVYENPMKPIIYCKWQNEAENKANAEVAEKQAEAERQQQAAMQAANEAVRDSFQKHVEEYRNRLEMERVKSDEADEKFKEFDRERRMKKLERAEEDRKNRENSMIGK